MANFSRGELMELEEIKQQSLGDSQKSHIAVSAVHEKDGGENGVGQLSSILRVRRLFNTAQIFAFSLTYMGSWEAINGSLIFGLYNGGPQALAWSMLIAYFGALAQSASLAEMASCVPIAGAQYHWTNVLAPQRIKRVMTWIQGWMTWFGWVSLLASATSNTSILLQNTIILNNPTYIPQPWHVTMIMISVLVTFGLVNSTRWTFAVVPWLELVAGILHVALFVLFMIVLLVLGTRHSTDYIFFHTESSSGWTNSFVSWNLGALTSVWAFVGFDGAIHMAEEVKQAKKAVPRAVFWSIALNGLLAYAIMITLLCVMGPIDDALLGTTFAAAEIFMRVTGSVPATTAMLVGVFIVSASSTLASVASLSRLTWAWSRDGGLPKWFAFVDGHHLLPIRAIWFGMFLVMLLSLIYIGSSAAFAAIAALCSLALYFSYAIAIIAMLSARYMNNTGGQPLKLGDWNLGKYGLAINIFALVYTLYMMSFFPIPSYIPVTAVNMNYSGPIFLFVILVISVWWLVWARTRWPGINERIVDLVQHDSS